MNNGNKSLLTEKFGARLPELLAGVMAAIIPPMLPGVAPIIAPKMTDYLEKQAVAKRK